VVGGPILGFTSFSSIALATLWYYSWEWIQLRTDYPAHGLAFGSVWQVGLAWFAVFAAFPLLVLTVFLAVRAMELPRRLYYLIRGGVRPAPARVNRPRRTSVPARPARASPDYVASFWNGSP
jgi:hypothetical protein